MIVMNFPESVVNGFEQYFNSVYSKSQPTATQDYVADFFTTFSFTIQTITREEILNGLKRLKNSFTSGIDVIPSFLIKHCAMVLVEPMCHLYILIFKTHTFPKVWTKISNSIVGEDDQKNFS